MKLRKGKNGVPRISFGRSKRRPSMSPSRKRRVLERDSRVCHLCGLGGADTVDHVLPHSLGGDSSMENLKAAHEECNMRRGNDITQ